MTLKRTSPLRRRPDADYASVPVRKEAKPAKGPRTVKCGLRGCLHRFVPDPERPMVKWCSLDCGALMAIAAGAARKAKLAKTERAATKVRKDALKRRADYLRETQAAFNAWVRERDADKPCICCGRKETKVDGLHSHGWDAGHYRSVGSAPHLRFHEDNVHRQLVYCNRDRSGNATDYRLGLIARIGLPAVEALERDQSERKWTIPELQAMKDEYRARLRALTKGTT